MTEFDQYLVDYTVRNITTGDEEEIRVLELTDDELAGFPEPVRAEIRDIVRRNEATTRWDTDQDRIVALLLPYISKPALYRDDYGTWEEWVLGDAPEEGAP